MNGAENLHMAKGCLSLCKRLTHGKRCLCTTKGFTHSKRCFVCALIYVCQRFTHSNMCVCVRARLFQLRMQQVCINKINQHLFFWVRLKRETNWRKIFSSILLSLSSFISSSSFNQELYLLYWIVFDSYNTSCYKKQYLQKWLQYFKLENEFEWLVKFGFRCSEPMAWTISRGDIYIYPFCEPILQRAKSIDCFNPFIKWSAWKGKIQKQFYLHKLFINVQSLKITTNLGVM